MKFKIKKFRHIFLFAAGGVMGAAVVFSVVFMLNFLLSRLTRALNVEAAPQSAVKFDTDKFEKLGLLK